MIILCLLKLSFLFSTSWWSSNRLAADNTLPLHTKINLADIKRDLEIVALLIRYIPPKCKNGVYEASIWWLLMYGSDTWTVIKKVENIPKSCDCRMIRYMTGIKWKEIIPVSSQEISIKCGLKDFSSKIRSKRLQWFGHVKRDMNNSGCLGSV